jgi:hypothetical protein
VESWSGAFKTQYSITPTISFAHTHRLSLQREFFSLTSRFDPIQLRAKMIP